MAIKGLFHAPKTGGSTSVTKKEERISTVLDLCCSKGSIIRSDVEMALGVSQSTATFTVTAAWLKKLTAYSKQDKLSVDIKDFISSEGYQKDSKTVQSSSGEKLLSTKSLQERQRTGQKKMKRTSQRISCNCLLNLES